MNPQSTCGNTNVLTMYPALAQAYSYRLTTWWAAPVNFTPVEGIALVLPE